MKLFILERPGNYASLNLTNLFGNCSGLLYLYIEMWEHYETWLLCVTISALFFWFTTESDTRRPGKPLSLTPTNWLTKKSLVLWISWSPWCTWPCSASLGAMTRPLHYIASPYLDLRESYHHCWRSKCTWCSCQRKLLTVHDSYSQRSFTSW